MDQGLSEYGVEQTKPAPLWEAFENWARSDFGIQTNRSMRGMSPTELLTVFIGIGERQSPRSNRRELLPNPTSRPNLRSAIKRKVPLKEENPLPPPNRGKRDKAAKKKTASKRTVGKKTVPSTQSGLCLGRNLPTSRRDKSLTSRFSAGKAAMWSSSQWLDGKLSEKSDQRLG